MKMPISEIIDRYTITRLKSERTNEDVQLELDSYLKEIESYNADLDEYIDSLYIANVIANEKIMVNGKTVNAKRITKKV